MHTTALENARGFFKAYAPNLAPQGRILEVGSQDVNGALRALAPPGMSYTGVDATEGPGVDLVLRDPYQLPFPTGSFDLCLTSSVFEHVEMFWVLFLELLRVLKPEGLLYLNAPSNGQFHRYPVDCWRFYPDSGGALVTWAARNGFDPLLLESYISRQVSEDWNDFVAVFLKEARYSSRHPHRILDAHNRVFNARVHGKDGFLCLSDRTEDELRLEAFRRDGFEYLKT